MFQSPTLDTLHDAPVSTYRPFPRQQVFHADPAKYRLFGGAAGPGKSRAILEEGITTCLEVAGCEVLILRRTFQELEASIINKFLNDVPYKRMGAKYNSSKHVVLWPNGSLLRFGYCRNENDVYQYQGGAYLQILFDELTFFTLKMWQFLSSRNRADGKLYTAGPNKGLPAYANMAGASNPGNTGHEWCKSLFIEGHPASQMERAEQYNSKDYSFIPAFIDDNPIYANDGEYRATLEALPELLKRAFLLGDWNIFAGQYFDCFQRGQHTCPPETLVAKPWYPIWISIDWGFEHHSAVYWHRQEGDRTVTFRELVDNHLTPIQLAQKIVDAMREKDKYGQPTGKITEKIHEVYLSTETWDKHSWGEHSIPELMGDVFVEAGMPRPTPADNDRQGGWMLMYQLLKNDCWMISEACPTLIMNLPAMTRDYPDHPEDCKKVDGDDPSDSARYGLKSKLSPGRKPVSVRVEERVALLNVPEDNPTATMMLTARIAAEEKKKFKPKRFFGPRAGGFRR